MKVYGVALTTLAVVSLAVAARPVVFQATEDTEEPVSATSAMQVEVLNFPVDTAGDLKVRPTRNTLIDLVDSPITLQQSEMWYSDAFDVERFTRLGFRVEGTTQPGSYDIVCFIRWAWFPGDSFVGPVASGSSHTEGGTWVSIYGSSARLECASNDPEPATLTALRVLLRRE